MPRRPRGVGRFFGYPVTQAETRDRLRTDRAINEGCAERRSAIVDHASTADVARDMDVIRQALGEEQLSYYGISYGSLLGQTYAAMFPDRVRALIIDGVLHPIEWTSGNDPSLPMTYRLRSGRGAYEALTSALAECDRVGRARCAIAGHANETWLRVVRKARAGELRIDGTPDQPAGRGQQRSRVAVLDAPRSATSSSSSAAGRPGPRSVADGARTRPSRHGQQLQADPGRAGRDRSLRVGRRGPVTARCAAGVPVLPAVRERDLRRRREPHHSATWADTSALADHRQPWFGRSWTWASSVCAQWAGLSGDDAFRGPWATTTSYPLLVVGNAHDPATPISGARAANRLFADSVLLLMNGWGHGALGDSDCVSSYMAAYLIDRTLPACRARCAAPTAVLSPARPSRGG